MPGKGRGNQWLRALAVAAPRRAELDDGGPGQRVDVGACRLGGRVGIGHGHGGSLLVAGWWRAPRGTGKAGEKQARVPILRPSDAWDAKLSCSIVTTTRGGRSASSAHMSRAMSPVHAK